MPDNLNHHTNGTSILNGYPAPVGIEKSTALANILKGYEDFTLDTHGKIISSNLEAVNITGYEEWEAIGRHFSIFYTAEDKIGGQPDLDLAKVRLCTRITFSAWRVKKRNVTFWAQVTMVCLKDVDDTITGYKMILKDQTHRLISTNRVRKFRSEYLNVFNNPFIGIFKFKAGDYKITLINDKAGKIIGIGKEPKKFTEIFRDPDELRRFQAAMERDGLAYGFEFRVNNGHSESWARIDCRVFEAEGFVEGVISDITESKKQLLELKRLNEELDNFIYHASHDLRSPLTSLLGLINLMEVDTQIALQDYCAMMRERVTYLDELLRDMTAIAYNSKADVADEQINFDEILRALIKDQQTLNAKIEIRVDTNTPVAFRSDPERIQAILKYLLTHAIRHHNPHAKTPFIQVDVCTGARSATIRFRDNGRGIRDDQLSHIFGMFYKINNEVRETGLSLYITRLMVEKLQGRISVKSRIGFGTDIEIELPVTSGGPV